MDINDLTIRQARELASIFSGGNSSQSTCGCLHAKSHPAIGKYVIVRTFSAGVHAGFLQYVNGKEVLLTASRRIWSWQGALSCSEIAMRGITDGKVAVEVPEQFLTEAIEIIPTSKEASICLQTIAK